MYLKSLQILGFKSFADKTLFEFDKGVTGIVGPNGCGKSNVVDAIRWVLGETSAKALRGGEMTDVIFNGTEKRRPLGMAEVTLVMADCEDALKVDYNEMAITRRVYRDGKSEYRLNGTLCRLRDIHELFMDTGISRSAYSIMEQGKIDMLLSSRPEDRRAVFEEAAGITKFKKDKKDALRKLDHTRANLLRITDVLEEQERRMSALQRQVSKARRYQTLRSHVFTLDAHLSHHSYTQLSAELSELTASKTSLTARRELLTNQKAERQAQMKEARQQARALDARITAAATELATHRSELASANATLAFNAERRTELVQRITDAETELAETRETLIAHRARTVHARSQLDQLTATIDGKNAELAAFSEQVSSTTGAALEAAEQSLRISRSREASAHTRTATLQTSIDSLKKQLTITQEQLVTQRSELRSLSSDLQTAQRSKRDVDAARNRQVDAVSSSESAVTAAEEAVSTATEELDLARESVRQLHRKHAERSSRLDVLEQLLASGEGFEKGTQAVLNGLDEPKTFSKGISGVLASAIKVVKNYSRAVEAALGTHLQAVVVKDSELAEAIISRLIEKQLGEAELIPSEDLAEQPAPDTKDTPAGAHAWALDKVTGDTTVHSLLNDLLGKTLIVDSLSIARKLRKEMPDVTFVTVEGAILSPSGIMRGGATKHGNALVLDRQSEVTHLLDIVDRLATELESAQHDFTKKSQSLELAQNSLNASRQRSLTSATELSHLSSQSLVAEREVSSISTDITRAQTAIASAENRINSLTAETREHHAELENTTLQLSAFSSEQADLQADLEKKRNAQKASEDTLSDLKTAVLLARQAHGTAKANQAPLETRITELEDRIARKLKAIEGFKERITLSKTEDEQLTASKGLKETSICEHESEISRISAAHAPLAEKTLSEETQLAELVIQLEKITSQLSREDIQTTKLELRIDNLVDTAQSRYNLELATFHPALDELALVTDASGITVPQNPDLLPGEEAEPNWETVATILATQRLKLDAIGPVNIDAIEEFEELETRYTSVKQQHDDLSAASASLLSVIEKINAETTQLFTETFAKVRANFREMFEELFGKSGEADLVLIDDDDPLESGIEVIAKPPGKKLQSISLLSGGERSMTAVALLFSIYMVKPSPFCVLDELDAPLDEANISRFLRVLDRFIDQSQFIIVTHSKRTMNRADVMYGVTMEERGVSKQVGMRLTASADPEKLPARTPAQRAAVALDA